MFENEVREIRSQDHREVAQRLDLLHFQEDAPGMVFFHPRGFQLYRLLEEAVRAQARAQGYLEVRTPQILRRAVWEASGHWFHFRHGMFRIALGDEDPSCESAVKPVSCPGHINILKQRVVSYRELPLRVSELGIVHRDEPSGTLHGLLRLRQFTQDDGHVFCTREQAEDEVLRFCESVVPFYRAFGFDEVEVGLSTRPAARAGDDASWDHAERALEGVLRRWGVPFNVQSGEGAFYGPKLEFALKDRLGRKWQCGTIQFDLSMPRSFDLRYVDRDGERRHPVMLHRALYGSVERFLGILLEHHGANLPPWLSPVQVRVLPVSSEHAETARALVREFERAGLRADLSQDDTLSRRIAEAHADAVPFVGVVGAKEAASGTVSVRAAAAQWSAPVDEALRRVAAACASPFDARTAKARGGGALS